MPLNSATNFISTMGCYCPSCDITCGVIPPCPSCKLQEEYVSSQCFKTPWEASRSEAVRVCSSHAMTSSVVYYSTDARKNEIYLLKSKLYKYFRNSKPEVRIPKMNKNQPTR